VGKEYLNRLFTVFFLILDWNLKNQGMCFLKSKNQERIVENKRENTYDKAKYKILYLKIKKKIKNNMFKNLKKSGCNSLKIKSSNPKNIE